MIKTNLDKIELDLIKGKYVDFIYNNKNYQISLGEQCELDDVYVLFENSKCIKETYTFKELLNTKINKTTLKETLLNCQNIKSHY